MIKEEQTAYPLCWPIGQVRTPSHKQAKSKFVGGDVMKAQRDLRDEVRRLGGRSLLISSNVAIRQDGQVYADAARRKITDPGVAVYFDMKGQEMCFACDRWLTPWENIQAIAKTIEALRGIERWGSSDMVERSFRGYAALPPPMVTEPPKKSWREVLGFDEPETPEWDDVASAYRARAGVRHPDNGGTHEGMTELNGAMAEAKKEYARS